jgi:hypothetical protein
VHDPDHPIGFKKKIKLLKRWFNRHPALVVLSLSNTRNTFLHSILDSYDPKTQTAIFRSLQAKTDHTCEFHKSVGTLENLLRFAEAAQRAHLQFVSISAPLFAPDVIARLRSAPGGPT